jgi:hypothetical protein
LFHDMFAWGPKQLIQDQNQIWLDKKYRRRCRNSVTHSASR